jgi:integrase
MPTPRKRPTSEFYWIRKKVPDRYRPLVGRTEVWRSLETKDLRTAVRRCAAASDALETEWARLAAASANCSNPDPEAEPRPALTHRDLHALRAIAHRRIRDAHIAAPPVGFAALRVVGGHGSDEDRELEVREFLAGEGIEATDEEVARFLPLMARARKGALDDLKRAALEGDFEDSKELKGAPQLEAVKVDIMEAFRSYCDRPKVIKDGLEGKTAERWEPVITQFIKFIGHRDLARVTQHDAVRWRNHKLKEGIEPKSVRDVWLAAPRSICTHMINELKLPSNPFGGIKVDGVKAWKEDDERGFDEPQVLAILTATLATPSHLISPEMKAARRWVPWLCAYTGARISEITSLWPDDVERIGNYRVIVIKAGLAKSKNMRRVPVHQHLIDQDFVDYVEQRKELGKPLFYEPSRARGGRKSNPQYAKVGERIAEWIRESLHITGVQPNHGWRHLFRELSRGTEMKEEVVNYMVGHESKSGTSARYGKRKIPMLAAEMAKFPRFDVPALNEPPAPHKRVRRTNTEVAAAKAKKQARKAAGSTRAQPEFV